MTSVVSSVFGGKQKPAGPSPEMLALQKQQADDLAARRKKEDEEKAARRRVIDGRSGRGQGVTLNQETGEAGVKDKLGS